MKIFITILEHISFNLHAQETIMKQKQFIKNKCLPYCQTNCFGYAEPKTQTLNRKISDTRLGRWNVSHENDIVNKNIDFANIDNGI